MADAPLSAEQIEERTRTGPDGGSATTTLRSEIDRDAAGRMRVDWSLEGPDGTSFPIAYLIDPIARFSAILLGPYNIAHRTVFSASAEFRVGFPGLGEALPDVPWQTHTEDLGTRTIEGVEVTGARITRVSDGQPPLRASDERWFARDLGLTVLAEASGPGWRHVVRLQKIERREPDASLFAIPSDYKIQDAPR